MPLRTTISIALAGLCLSAVEAIAADMPARTIGELFERPVVVETRRARKDDEHIFVNPFPYAPGYYGRWGDFGQGAYYGTSVIDIYSRAPYACIPSSHGVC